MAVSRLADVDYIIVIIEVTLSYMTAALMAYHLYRYFRARYQATIQKRFYLLVVLINLLSIILLTVHMPLLAMTNFNELDHVSQPFRPRASMP